jgi:hypothetical protein
MRPLTGIGDTAVMCQHNRPCVRPIHSALALALAGLAILHAPAAHANDRPFQSARTAVAEDDEGTWSIESWVQRLGRVRAASVEPEYGFTTMTSVQMEFTRVLDRQGDDTGHEAEVEFKHLFNHIARDGYGWGVSAALAWERSRAEGTQHRLTLKLPLSIALGETGALLHVNAGVFKPSRDKRQFTTSVAAEMGLPWRSRGFVELAREGREHYGQLGVRHWVKRERLALDVSLQQRRSGGERASGVLVGLGFYDL